MNNEKENCGIIASKWSRPLPEWQRAIRRAFSVVTSEPSSGEPAFTVHGIRCADPAEQVAGSAERPFWSIKILFFWLKVVDYQNRGKVASSQM